MSLLHTPLRGGAMRDGLVGTKAEKSLGDELSSHGISFKSYRNNFQNLQLLQLRDLTDSCVVSEV